MNLQLNFAIIIAPIIIRHYNTYITIAEHLHYNILYIPYIPVRYVYKLISIRNIGNKNLEREETKLHFLFKSTSMEFERIIGK